jgi:hypothetical protein
MMMLNRDNNFFEHILPRYCPQVPAIVGFKTIVGFARPELIQLSVWR